MGPEYSTFENNVALIFLPREVKNADTIQYPTLNLNEESNAPEDGDPLLVIGWGQTSSSGSGADVLLQAEANYAANEDCLATWMVGYTNGIMCIGIEDGRRAACTIIMTRVDL